VAYIWQPLQLFTPLFTELYIKGKNILILFMKKLIVLLITFCFFCFTKATTHYVAVTGNDRTGNGSSSSPWASLHTACNSVNNPGDVIHVIAGIYKEPSRCELARGVSIEGEGKATHIYFNYYDSSIYDAAIYLNSKREGTNGNQSISNMWLDGNSFVCYSAIMVRCRSNVIIHDVTFTNFQAFAVSFNGRSGKWGTAPDIYSSGNQFYNCKTTDCSDRHKGGAGVIALTSQTNWLIHDNTFIQTGKEKSHNGNIVGAVEGYNKNGKYYNNVSYKPNDESEQEWNFGIESWYDEGGIEVYGNTFNGGGNAIDVGTGGGLKGEYAYSWYIHDNLFQTESQLAKFPVGRAQCIGVQFEDSASDATITNNHFKNIGTGVQLTLSHGAAETQKRIYINNNLFENMGYADGSFGGFMVVLTCSAGAGFDSIFIDNNTFISGNIGHSRAALYINSASGQTSNIYFRNNIIKSVATYGYITFDGTHKIDKVFSQNNIIYNNSNNNNPFTRGSPRVTNFINTGNIVSDPQLDNNYHLKAGSPGIGRGTDVGHGKNIGAQRNKDAH